jgi:Protein of unknown function, DUF547
MLHSSPEPSSQKQKKPQRGPRIPWRALILLILLWLLGFYLSQAFSAQIVNDVLATQPFNHHIWNEVLHRRVANDGSFDFAGLKAEPGRFNAYLSQLGQYSPENHPEYFPRPDDVLAYWLNAYNALTLRKTRDDYPASPEQLSGLPARPTDYLIGGQLISIDEIKERIQDYSSRFPTFLKFALTDFTVDSPPLYQHAYEGQNLPKQLQETVGLASKNEHLLHFYESEPQCVAIEASSFWKKQLGANTPQNAELLDASIKPNGGSWIGDPQAEALAGMLKPYAPPEMQAIWNFPCAHQVKIIPVEGKLREYKEPGEEDEKN